MNSCLVCSRPATYQYCSLACSNTGRIVKNETKYKLNPKRCKQCGGALPYEKRHDYIFCSHSCSATYTNLKREHKKKPQKENRSLHVQMMEKFLQGNLTERSSIRKALIKIKGNLCAKCTMQNTWCDNPLTLVVDHVDGDAGNNRPSNLRLLCPNCNSQTTTFGGRNKGYGRQSRGLSRYA